LLQRAYVGVKTRFQKALGLEHPGSLADLQDTLLRSFVSLDFFLSSPQSLSLTFLCFCWRVWLSETGTWVNVVPRFAELAALAVENSSPPWFEIHQLRFPTTSPSWTWTTRRRLDVKNPYQDGRAVDV
jgi:hypothetical protein